MAVDMPGDTLGPDGRKRSMAMQPNSKEWGEHLERKVGIGTGKPRGALSLPRSRRDVHLGGRSRKGVSCRPEVAGSSKCSSTCSC